MGAGDYRKRVTILSPNWAVDSDGGLVESPAVRTTIATRWASLESASGSEVFRFQQRGAVISHTVKLREYLSTVTEKMLVSFETRIFEIRAVLHDEMKHRWTTLYCEEQK